jgi:hypothetical protein
VLEKESLFRIFVSKKVRAEHINVREVIVAIMGIGSSFYLLIYGQTNF